MFVTVSGMVTPETLVIALKALLSMQVTERLFIVLGMARPTSAGVARYGDRAIVGGIGEILSSQFSSHHQQ